MSYPQPNADSYAVNGSQFFRLNTLLSSPGDIYESAQGGHAFAIGPDSDIANVNVAYFDDQVPTYMNQTTISPERPWTGLLGARNEVNYMPAGRPGKIFMWPADLFDTSFQPPGFNSVFDIMTLDFPRLDAIQYFSPQQGLSSARNDKTSIFQDVPTKPGGPGTNSNFVMIPYWGRRYAMIELTNKSADPFTFALSGVNFSICENATGYHQITPILAPALVAPGAQVLAKVTSFVNGMFDMLMLQFQRGPAFTPLLGPVKVVVSDVAQD